MTYSAVRNKKNELIRKARDGSVFIANMTASPIITLTSAGTDEVQTVSITGTPTGGTFTLTFGGATTAPIVYNATAAAVDSALEALGSIGTGGVTVTGGPGPATAWTVTFTGVLASSNVAPITGSATGLTGGTTPTVTVTTTTPGVPVDLTALPSGYEDLGWTTTDGVTFARATNASDIASFGALEPTRSDITSDVVTMQVTAQETKLLTLGLSTGADTSGITAGVGGEVRINKPTRPSMRYYRVLGLFLDSDDNGNEIYLGRFMPRARITAYGDTQYNTADSAIQTQMTFTGYEDATLGYSHAWLYAGQGWNQLLAKMGL